MRTFLLMLLIGIIVMITGCGGDGPLPITIDRITPAEGVIGDRFRMYIGGIEDPTTLTILVNDKVIEPEVIYSDTYYHNWFVVVFTPTTEISVGDNRVTVVQDLRQGEINLEVVPNRLPIETPPFVTLIIPEDRKVSPGELVQIRMSENLEGKQVRALIVSLNGEKVNLVLSNGLLIEGDIIKFNMPAFVGEKALIMISIEGAEIFDYIEFFRE